MIPYGERHTLVGTTDVALSADTDPVQASEEEVRYLCRAVSRYLVRPAEPGEVAWRFAGVRPLYDDGSTDPSAVTRDYTLRVDDAEGRAPVLSVYGGKITTYRRLAEQALQKLAPYFPGMRGAWTARTPLAGSDFAGPSREQARDAFFARHPGLPQPLLRGVFRRHGTLSDEVIGGARSPAELGEAFGSGLTERELLYFLEREWASTAEDVLWRRTKAGLTMNEAERARVREVLGR
jgi:glycerol-3-phosphate dehydrogenase